MPRKVYFYLALCALTACSTIKQTAKILTKQAIIVKTTYPELPPPKDGSKFQDITVMVNKIEDSRPSNRIGTQSQLPMSHHEFLDYMADEKVSEIFTKKISDFLKNAGFNVLYKYSGGEDCQLEVKGRVLEYFVTVKGPLAGNFSEATVSFSIAIADTKNKKTIFKDTITHTLTEEDSLNPELINKTADEAIAKITAHNFFNDNIARWKEFRNNPSQDTPAREPLTIVREGPKPFNAANSQRWAVIMGISRYENAGEELPNIRYADKDAEAFYHFLLSETGGKMPRSNIRILLNEEATYQNMREALFEFLKQAIEEDIVYIYFAGHGSPEPDNKENLYLLPYDTDPDKIASTAFPMRDIESVLNYHLKAQRTLVFADACHSGGIKGDFNTRGVVVEGNPINNFLKNLSKTRPGRGIITASESAELSAEGEKWGGGHGVFTYHLLEGLRGKADLNNDKLVTLGEAMMYTDEQVRRDTKSRQHPTVSGKIDMNMPLSAVK